MKWKKNDEKNIEEIITKGIILIKKIEFADQKDYHMFDCESTQ